jgi:hypothetical protein
LPDKKRVPKVVGPDGRERLVRLERQINEQFAETFRTPAAKKVLDYLKSITINAVAGPEQSDAALRHLEGSRFIVGLISTRVEMGVNQIAKVKEGED